MLLVLRTFLLTDDFGRLDLNLVKDEKTRKLVFDRLAADFTGMKDVVSESIDIRDAEEVNVVSWEPKSFLKTVNVYDKKTLESIKDFKNGIIKFPTGMPVIIGKKKVAQSVIHVGLDRVLTEEEQSNMTENIGELGPDWWMEGDIRILFPGESDEFPEGAELEISVFKFIEHVDNTIDIIE